MHKPFRFDIGERLILDKQLAGPTPVTITQHLHEPRYSRSLTSGRSTLDAAIYRVREDGGSEYPAAENSLSRPKRK